MKKRNKIIVPSIISFAILLFLIAVLSRSNREANADTNSESYQSVSHENKTILAAVKQLKGKDAKFVREYFSGQDKDTKVLATKENDGYGFLAGSATDRDGNGKIIAQYDANTDPDSATIADIEVAVADANKN